jgi:hypothetical protein
MVGGEGAGDSGFGDVVVGKCTDHCRATFGSIEQTLDLIDQARQCGDAGIRDDLLLQARAYLLHMHQEMGKCLIVLDGTRVETNPPGAAREWACPMHQQVRRDKPGNCPLCDMRLEVVGEQALQTRPTEIQSAWRFAPSELRR